mgnify:CR=1 FL=1
MDGLDEKILLSMGVGNFLINFNCFEILMLKIDENVDIDYLGSFCTKK